MPSRFERGEERIDRGGPAALPAGGSERDALLDNARFALIALVVIVHVIRLSMFDVAGIRGLYVALVVFLMPAFAAVAGHLSRADLTLRDAFGVVRRLVVPYLVFEVLLRAVAVASGRAERIEPTLWTPTWLMWFLIALALWRLSLPALTRTRAPLLVAVLVGVTAGFLPSAVYELSLMRALVLYPFFVLGFVARREWLEDVRHRVTPASAFLALAVIGTLAAIRPDATEPWLHGTQPFARMDAPLAAGPWLRLTHYVAATVALAAFLALVPRGRGRLTPLGARTLHPYLLHGPVLFAATPVLSATWDPRWLQSVVLVPAGFALAVVLSTRAVATVVRPLVDPIGVAATVARRRRSRAAGEQRRRRSRASDPRRPLARSSSSRGS